MLRAAETRADERWIRGAAITVIVLAGAWLLRQAVFHHPIGDYATESDFYGGYVDGARLLQHGVVDPARYDVVGPGYEIALAAAGLAVRDLFLAAKLLSVLAAVATLGFWYRASERSLGMVAGLVVVLAAATNSVFLRYGHAVTTDAFATALAAASVAALFASRTPRGAIVAGAMAAAATLTRYNLVALVPAAVVCLAGTRIGGEGRARVRRTLLYLAAFLALAAPWTVFSLSRGVVPGSRLIGNIGFYTSDSARRDAQDRPVPDPAPGSPGPSVAPAGAVSAGTIVARATANVPQHLLLDARELLRVPLAVFCLAGLVACVGLGVWRSLLPFWIVGASLFLALVPVFYSERYTYLLLPCYVAAPGTVLAHALFRRRVLGVPARWIVVTVLLAVVVPATIAEQRWLEQQEPIEVLAAARQVRDRVPQGGRVVARKAHFGYETGLVTVPFPRLGTLPELASYARREHATVLYYSWYEAGLRPEFRYLLDSTAVVPGLTALYRAPSAAVFRIEDGFGAVPDWLADAKRRRVHDARAMVRLEPDSVAWRDHAVLGVDAIERGAEASEILAHGRAVVRGAPDLPLGWAMVGQAERLAGRSSEAADAYARALALDPSNDGSRATLGKVEIEAGRFDRAAETLRPLLERTRDLELLSVMAELYQRIGDASSAHIATARRDRARRAAP